jgi:hypothetical protein
MVNNVQYHDHYQTYSHKGNFKNQQVTIVVHGTKFAEIDGNTSVDMRHIHRIFLM